MKWFRAASKLAFKPSAPEPERVMPVASQKATASLSIRVSMGITMSMEGFKEGNVSLVA